LPPLEAVGYVRQACEAVAEAHSLGIVHRDLKPANLFLSQRPNGARLLKVLDFGISKLVTGAPQRLSITDTSILLGSPAYMSPEQLECSRSVDGRADVWSLGVILYELIAGRLPFNGDSVPQLIRSVVTGARSPLVGDDPRLAHLEPIIARCLVQERAERFQSVRELSAALDAALRLDPASPPIESARTSAAQLDPAPCLELSPEELPSAAATPAPAAAERTGPSGADGAWGRTHGARGVAWHRRGIPLAALLALIALGSVWGVRSERRAAERVSQRATSPSPTQPSAATQPERVVAQLTPSPVVAPVPQTLATPEPSAAPPPAAGSDVPPGKPAAPVTSPAPAVPAVSRPAAPASSAATVTAPALGGTAAPTPAAPAPSGATSATSASTPNPASAPPASETHPPRGADEPQPAATPPASTPPASAPLAATPPAPTAREVVPPHDGRFEIPEFGGRE
jgi:serine/threonine-protein kinase